MKSELFRIVEIEITTRCNLACSYCPNSKGEDPYKSDMTQEAFEHILYQLKEINFQGLLYYHFYGEPLLHKELEKFISLSKTILPQSKPAIFTNGTLLTKKKFYSLIESGVDYFYITRQEESSKIPFMDFQEELEDDLKKKIKFQDHTKINLSTRGGALEFDESKEMSFPLSLPCFIPKNRMVILYNGDILPCFEDYYRTLVMGNIFKSSLQEIWDDPKYVQFREDLAQKKGRFKSEICSKCNNVLLR